MFLKKVVKITFAIITIQSFYHNVKFTIMLNLPFFYIHIEYLSLCSQFCNIRIVTYDLIDKIMLFSSISYSRTG
jgi:hypothetical protein